MCTVSSFWPPIFLSASIAEKLCYELARYALPMRLCDVAVYMVTAFLGQFSFEFIERLSNLLPVSKPLKTLLIAHDFTPEER